MEELHKGPTDIPAPAPVKLTKRRPAPVSRFDVLYIVTMFKGLKQVL